MGRYGTISAHEGSWVQGHEFRAYRAFTALSCLFLPILAYFCLFVRVFGRIQRLKGDGGQREQHRGRHRRRRRIPDLFCRLRVP